MENEQSYIVIGNFATLFGHSAERTLYEVLEWVRNKPSGLPTEAFWFAVAEFAERYSAALGMKIKPLHHFENAVILRADPGVSRRLFETEFPADRFSVAVTNYYGYVSFLKAQAEWMLEDENPRLAGNLSVEVPQPTAAIN